jgi:TPR repeat protein
MNMARGGRRTNLIVRRIDEMSKMNETDPSNQGPAARARAAMDVAAGSDLQKACAIAEENESDAECAYLLGLFKYTGKGAPQDRKAAAELFAESAGKGYEPASIVSEEIKSNPEDVEAPIMDLRLKAECRDTVSCRKLFTPYDTGKNADGSKAPVKKNHAEAVRLYMPCADAGDTEAQNIIGYMYLMGKGIPKDREMALKLLTEAADHGCAQAAHRIAVMYDTGQNFSDPDLDKAVEWYTKASDMGYADSQYALAGILFMEDSPYYDNKRAINLLHKAADQGQHDAEHQLGLRLAYGAKGEKRDPKKAEMYLERACEGGVLQAMTDYANMLFEGQAVPQDLAKSAKWFTKAAEQYDGIAQYALGCFYGNGYYYRRTTRRRPSGSARPPRAGSPTPSTPSPASTMKAGECRRTPRRRRSGSPRPRGRGTPGRCRSWGCSRSPGRTPSRTSRAGWSSSPRPPAPATTRPSSTWASSTWTGSTSSRTSPTPSACSRWPPARATPTRRSCWSS